MTARVAVVAGHEYRACHAKWGERSVTRFAPNHGEVWTLMSTLKQLQGDVARRMRRGDGFATVEEQVIDPSPLSDEKKAALWLYGWSFVSPRRQRSEAVAHIDRLDSATACRPSDPLVALGPAVRTARRDLDVARADLEGAVRDHHATLRRSGLRPR